MFFVAFMLNYTNFNYFRAVTDPRNSERVALKKMPHVFQNLVTAKRVFRELRMLCSFRHDNVLSAKDVLLPCSLDTFDELYVLTPLMQSDLHKIIVSNQMLTLEHVKIFTYQILRGTTRLYMLVVPSRTRMGDVRVLEGTTSISEELG